MIVATLKQKKAVDNLVGNGGNITQAMLDAGYSKATANTPQKLTESVGFDKLCEEAGLTDDFILRALREDIDAKAGQRCPELNLAADIRGLKKQKHEITGKDGSALFITWGKLPEQQDYASDIEGQEDQEEHGEGVRQGEGRESVLCEQEQGNDQGSGQVEESPYLTAIYGNKQNAKDEEAQGTQSTESSKN